VETKRTRVYHTTHKKVSLNGGPDAISRIQVLLKVGEGTEPPKEISQEQKAELSCEVHSMLLEAHLE
jgi:hypothetical protein